MTAHRVANLDLLRAAAIVPVVLTNGVGEGVIDAGRWTWIAEAGWVGVDLFFVLSGWLIGGLYWRELNRYGDVQRGRFWARRWLRTIPPYLAAFAIVFFGRASIIGAEDPLDVRYLVFLQNYAPPIPYWGVSWSLCVEEHFYLALPLVLGAALRVRGGVPLVLGAAALGSLLARVFTVPDGAGPWGLHYTATHMRLEGLALGVAAAYVFHRHPAVWPSVIRGARALVAPGLLFVAAVPLLPLDVINRFAYAGVDLAFVALLVVVADRAPLPLASSRVVRAVALTSYSVYMTHTLVFDAYRRLVVERAAGLPPIVHIALALVLIGVVGAAFYAVAERPSLWLRRRLVPRRGDVPSPALATILPPAP